MNSDDPFNPQAEPAANPLWGGRFSAGPAAIMAQINRSIEIDRRLHAEDIAASKAHTAMLSATGIITAEEGAAIADGLNRIAAEIAAGTFHFKDELEDIHMNIEARLAELIGPVAGKLHTARSRNDQVVTDFRLWLRRDCHAIDTALRKLQTVLISRAEDHVQTILPGLTHLQPAQPVSLAHYLLAYVEALGRDRERFRSCQRRLNECPLGAAALAGTSHPIDRQMTSDALGFAQPMANSIDAVSARDFALEYLSAGAILSINLSRLAEEIVLWASPFFGFIQLSDAFTSGSSIMPQKRNPDAAELIRAKSGAVTGALVQLLTVLKALPFGYAKDMQEDKAPVFAASDTLHLCLAAASGMIADLQVNAARMREAAEAGFITATDLADYLVIRLGVPFRAAHHTTGEIVKRAEQAGKRLDQLSLAELREIEPRIEPEISEWLSIEGAVNRRTSEGGTAPVRVQEALLAAKQRFLGEISTP